MRVCAVMTVMKSPPMNPEALPGPPMMISSWNGLEGQRGYLKSNEKLPSMMPGSLSV